MFSFDDRAGRRKLVPFILKSSISFSAGASFSLLLILLAPSALSVDDEMGARAQTMLASAHYPFQAEY